MKAPLEVLEVDHPGRLKDHSRCGRRCLGYDPQPLTVDPDEVVLLAVEDVHRFHPASCLVRRLEQVKLTISREDKDRVQCRFAHLMGHVSILPDKAMPIAGSTPSENGTSEAASHGDRWMSSGVDPHRDSQSQEQHRDDSQEEHSPPGHRSATERRNAQGSRY